MLNKLNPTHGIFADIAESFTDLFGNRFGHQTGISEQGEAYQANNTDKNLLLHSQAHLIMQSGATNPDIQNEHTFQSFGGPPTLGTKDAPGSKYDDIFADDEGVPIDPEANDGDYVANPWNIFNPYTWGEPGHSLKDYNVTITPSN